MVGSVVAQAWTESPLWSALIVAVAGSVTAAAWPWLSGFQRRTRFVRLIRRELAELSPHPSSPGDQPWWTHLRKRFVHEEILRRENISTNRDFILSLDPTVTYLVSQLWIAFEKRDLTQWLHHLDELSQHRKVRSPGLTTASAAWRRLGRDPDGGDTSLLRATGAGPGPSWRPSAELFQARLAAYSSLLAITGDEDPGAELSGRLRDWYYTDGNGLLLSGDSLVAFMELVDPGEGSEPAEAASLLRTHLKIDLGVRHPDELAVEKAETLDRRVF